MDKPQLHMRYRRDEALTFWRDRGCTEERCGQQWAIVPDIAICLAVIGDPPNSGFNSAARFCWRPEKEEDGSTDRPLSFLPDEMRGKANGKIARRKASSAQKRAPPKDASEWR